MFFGGEAVAKSLIGTNNLKIVGRGFKVTSVLRGILSERLVQLKFTAKFRQVVLHTKFLRLHFQSFGSTPTTLSRVER